MDDDTALFQARRNRIRALGAGVVGPLGMSVGSCGSASSGVQGDGSAQYPDSFGLSSLKADPIPVIAKPAGRASGLASPSYVDPVYGTYVYKATDRRDFADATAVRHDYSRRQAWNADGTRYLATTSNGYWLLYDARTFQPLPRSGHGGSLKDMAGDCEAIWHPTDPRKLWYTASNGGLAWTEKDVERDSDVVLFDFTGRLPWAGVTSVWTKSEGTPSADGRFFAFMATSYDAARQRNTIYGLFTYDREQNRILGTLDAARFGGAFPDHISISPSGRYAVPSWAFDKTLGTRAYLADFSSFVQLHPQSEHSDLAIGPAGQDVYVVTDYDRGAIRAVEIATGRTFDLLTLYPRTGSGYAAHISGKAFGRPGWVAVSTYEDSANYGAVSPDPVLQPMYRKVMLIELAPGGRQLSVAHTRTAARYGGYGGEPQATISRDGMRIMFASNFDDGGPADSYVVAVPGGIY